MKALRVLVLMVALGISSQAAIVFQGSEGTLSAEVSFDVSGSQLIAVLSNTSGNDVLVPADVLTGVYFDYNGTSLILTTVSATLTAGSSVLFGGTDPGGVVGGEWAFVSALVGHPGVYAIGSAGYIPGNGFQFPGTNLQGPGSIDGLQYGLTSAGDNPVTGNTPVVGTNALIKNSVTFVLDGLPDDFDIKKLGNVNFQYGTSLLEEPGFPGEPPGDQVPEPATYSMICAGLLALALSRLRK